MRHTSADYRLAISVARLIIPTHGVKRKNAKISLFSARATPAYNAVGVWINAAPAPCRRGDVSLGVFVEVVLKQCLAQVPEARSVICVVLESGRVVAHAHTGAQPDHAQIDRLSAAATGLFRDDALGTAGGPGSRAVGEALIAGVAKALILLRCRKRSDIAVAFEIGRSADLGLALATARGMLAEIEAAL